MYPKTVNFNVPPFSNRQYPIQIKSLVRQILRGQKSVLQVSTESGIPLNYTIRRCAWEAEGLEVYNRMEIKEIFDLLQYSCESDWLVDTVYIYIPNNAYEQLTGSLTFRIVSESKIQKPEQPSSAEPIQINRPVLAYHVIKANQTNDVDRYSIAFLILLIFIVSGIIQSPFENKTKCSVFCIYYGVLCFYKRLFNHDCYNLMDHLRYKRPFTRSELAEGGVELIRYHSEENAFEAI
uniref:Transcriptional regulator n=1 Tax=Caenorhabditis tropicalis TaxID=1561998 RepID=A0A1I7UVN9_9PELO